MFIFLLKQTDNVSSCIIIHSQCIMTTFFVRFTVLYRGRRPKCEITINEQTLTTDMSPVASHPFYLPFRFIRALEQIRIFFISFWGCHITEIWTQRIFGLVPSYVLKSNTIHFGERFGPDFEAYFSQNNHYYVMTAYIIIQSGLTFEWRSADRFI